MKTALILGSVFSVLLLATATTAKADTVVGSFTKPNGSVSTLVLVSNTSGVKVWRMDVNSNPVLDLTSWPAPAQEVVATLHSGGPTVDALITTTSAVLASFTLSYNGSSATYEYGASSLDQADQLSDLEPIVSAIKGSAIHAPLGRLRNILESMDPVSAGTVDLMIPQLFAERESPGTSEVESPESIDDYMTCLESACSTAGGDWSYGPAVDFAGAGCHCNPSTHGLSYCASSAVIYLIGEAACLWRLVV